ncbi:MAG TPA: hypothetical protein VJ913_07825 [Actinomycetota bacterium]|nr:hypothetical protein [Actinomycetota bacterium]
MDTPGPTTGALYGIDGPRRRPRPWSLPPEEVVELVAASRATYAASRHPDRLDPRFDELREEIVTELRGRIDEAVERIQATFEAEIEALRTLNREEAKRLRSANGEELARLRAADTDELERIRVAIDEGIGRLCDLLEDELDALRASTRPAER